MNTHQMVLSWIRDDSGWSAFDCLMGPCLFLQVVLNCYTLDRSSSIQPHHRSCARRRSESNKRALTLQGEAFVAAPSCCCCSSASPLTTALLTFFRAPPPPMAKVTHSFAGFKRVADSRKLPVFRCSCRGYSESGCWRCVN